MSQKLAPLPWITEASRHIGLSEIAGKQHNPTLINWLITLKAWWRDDETPWCGTFIAHCAKAAGRDLPKHWYRALAWADSGARLSKPAYGCVVTFNRVGGGHVGFCVGQDAEGNLWILGGNQGNKVSIAKFPRSRVYSYTWLGKNGARQPEDERFTLPIINKAGDFSHNEA